MILKVLQLLTVLLGPAGLITNTYLRLHGPVIRYEYHQVAAANTGTVVLVLQNNGHSPAKNVSVVLRFNGSLSDDQLLAPTVLDDSAETFRQLSTSGDQAKYTLSFAVRPGDNVRLWVETVHPDANGGMVLREPPTIWAEGTRVMDSQQYLDWVQFLNGMFLFAVLATVLAGVWWLTARLRKRQEMDHDLSTSRLRDEYETMLRTRTAAGQAETEAALQLTQESVQLNRVLLEKAGEYIAGCRPYEAARHQISLTYYDLLVMKLETDIRNFQRKRGE